MVSVNQEFVKDVTVANAYGLHARPAAEFVKLAGTFKSEILVSKDGLEVNGKSIMGVMMLAAEKGSSLQISIWLLWTSPYRGRMGSRSLSI